MDTADKFHRVESLKHYKSYGVGKPSTWKTSQSQRSNYTNGPQEVFTLKEYMDEAEELEQALQKLQTRKRLISNLISKEIEREGTGAFPWLTNLDFWGHTQGSRIYLGSFDYYHIFASSLAIYISIRKHGSSCEKYSFWLGMEDIDDNSPEAFRVGLERLQEVKLEPHRHPESEKLECSTVAIFNHPERNYIKSPDIGATTKQLSYLGVIADVDDSPVHAWVHEDSFRGDTFYVAHKGKTIYNFDSIHNSCVERKFGRKFIELLLKRNSDLPCPLEYYRGSFERKQE